MVTLAAIATLSTTWPTVHAQENPLRNALAAKFKLSADSPLIDGMIANLERPTTSEDAGEPRPERPVLAHLRGKEGVLFSTKAELEVEYARMRKENSERYQEALADPKIRAELDAANQQLLNPPDLTAQAPELPSCPKDLTVASLLEDPTRSGTIGRDERASGDLLFIRGDLPMDPDLAFGKDTSVVQYTTKPGDYLSLVAAAEGISCLPYRIRITQRHSIHHLGLDALKNYDNSPKGVLYEGIKAKLRAYR